MSYSPNTHAIIWYVESHLMCDKMDYNDMERQIGFSYAHIRDLFKKNTGCSLARYVRIRKMWISAFDLLHTNQSILEIALSYGFSSQESFSRAFVSVVGMTPGRFRQKRMVVGKEELTHGVYGIGFLGKKERRSDMSINQKNYQDNESTVLFGVPKVFYGAFGGMTPFPICLKACSDYLGEDLDYAFSMVSSAAAFRLTWNEKMWDMSNVDIFHTFDETNDVYGLGIDALGREFDLLLRDDKTNKEDFVNFIKRHIDEGYPCIALGIIGPPEACLITGYRDQGNTLLGWNFFQDDPDFSSNISKDECGYFISDNWWENTDTQAVMCMGPVCKEQISQRKILKNAVRALTGRKDHDYYKGVMAYEAWEKMLSDESSFSVGDNYSVLFEKFLCQNDAMTCLSDGRGQAAKYFATLERNEKNQDKKMQFHQLAQLNKQIQEIMESMKELFGRWDDFNAMLKNFSDLSIRTQACKMIREAQKLDEKSLQIMNKLI